MGYGLAVIASASICIALGMDPDFVFKSLGYLKPARGRMEIVTDNENKSLVIIDYAHTPQALLTVLSSLKHFTKGKIITLFGCGGNRDIEKRTLMGQIAHQNSDLVIVTDDNPRKEIPSKIREDILQGCPNAIERIEGALLSYGNDMDNNDNPFECGLDKFVHLDSNINFLGKEKLKEVRKNGINKKLMGVIIDTNEISVSKSINLTNDENLIIGELRSGGYSPHFKKVIGIAMLNKPYYEVSQKFKISINDEVFEGKVCDLPFI